MEEQGFFYDLSPIISSRKSVICKETPLLWEIKFCHGWAYDKLGRNKWELPWEAVANFCRTFVPEKNSKTNKNNLKYLFIFIFTYIYISWTWSLEQLMTA